VNQQPIYAPPAIVTTEDPQTILCRAVASWYVRRENRFHPVDAPQTKLTLADLKRACLHRFRDAFPEIELSNEVLQRVFHRALEAQHNVLGESVPVWNGSMVCRPDVQDRIIWSDGVVSINSWQEPGYRRRGGTEADCFMLDHFLDWIFPIEQDRRVFKDWLSWCLQNEASKPGWAPFLYSRTKGTGKSTLCRLVSLLFGEENSITQNSVAKLTGRFNMPLLQSKLVISEELQLRPESTQGNTLKTYITETVTASEVKGREVEKVRQCCCFLFTTNHLPMWIEADERRYYVISVEHDGHASGPETDAFAVMVAKLDSYLADPTNVARLYNALMQHQQSNSFNPRSLNLSTIDTPVMQQIMGASREVQLQRLEELLAGLGRNALPQEELANLFVEELNANQNRIRHMMPELGWRSERVKWGGIDYARALWIRPDYQVTGGRVRGPDGYDEPISGFEDIETIDVNPAEMEVIGNDDY
jgi:hypothetical protein